MPVKKKQFNNKYLIKSFVFVIVVCSISYFLGNIINSKIDSQKREDLLSRARVIAGEVNASYLTKLNGSIEDLNVDEYNNLKQFLYERHSANDDLRFLYFVRSNNNGKLVFLVDSEIPASKDYSPPGQVYEDTTKIQYENYINEISYVEGPYHDSWGTWISAFTPIYHEEVQVGKLGIDVSADKWYASKVDIIFYSLVFGLFFSAIMLYVGYLKRSNSSWIFNALFL